jgi:hypothetical protein
VLSTIVVYVGHCNLGITWAKAKPVESHLEVFERTVSIDLIVPIPDDCALARRRM